MAALKGRVVTIRHDLVLALIAQLNALYIVSIS
jgi:hypothetical protein